MHKFASSDEHAAAVASTFECRCMPPAHSHSRVVLTGSCHGAAAARRDHRLAVALAASANLKDSKCSPRPALPLLELSSVLLVFQTAWIFYYNSSR